MMPENEYDLKTDPQTASWWSWRRGLCVAIAGLFVAYMIVLPFVEKMWPQSIAALQRIDSDMSQTELMRIWSVDALAAAWFCALGGMIGSFLNVVAYRVPLGRSVVFGRSYCPTCGQRIGLRDNIPVLGWLFLKGRCRSCSSAISPRYPLVEGILAGTFLLFYFAELISGGMNIPLREPNYYRGVTWILLETKWDIVLLYAYHMFLLSMLLVWALFAIDGARVPRRWVAATFAAATLAAIALPGLHPVGIVIQQELLKTLPTRLVQGFFVSCVGGLAGAILGYAVVWRMGTRPKLVSQENLNPHDSVSHGFDVSYDLVAGMSLLGITNGWQAALTTTAILLLFRGTLKGMSLVARGRFKTYIDRTPLEALLFLSAAVHLMFWRLIVGLWTEGIGIETGILFTASSV